MTKVSRKPVKPEKLGFYINNLWSAFTLMESKEQIKDLFRDLFTHTESKMIAKRLQIARMLLEGEKYESIMEETSVSEKTIAHVSNLLESRGEGFRSAHAKLLSQEKDHQRARDKYQDVLERKIRRKMPAETFIFDAAGAVLGKASDAIYKSVKRKSAKKFLDI